MFLDFWALNILTIKDNFVILVIDDTLVHGAKFFTKFDFCFGQHQIDTKDPNITFRTHEGNYEFLVMYFFFYNVHQHLRAS